jgi:hypothetical protein
MLTVFAFVATVVMAGFTLKTGNLLMMAGFVALPFVIMLMYRPDVAFVMAFVMDATGMGVPGVSYSTLGLLAKLVVIVTALMAFFMLPREMKNKAFKESRPLKFYVAIIVALMVFRGTGIRMLGSSTWGGMVYVVLLRGIAFIFAVQSIRLTQKQFRWLMWGMAFAGVIGAVNRKLGIAVSFEDASEVASSRMQWLRPFALAAFPLVFATNWKKWIKIILWILLLGAIGLTGFRSLLVGFVMITGIYGFFRASDRIRYIVFSCFVGIIIWVGVIVASPMFPEALQRAVSFVPGAKVDESTMRNASGSIEWRVDIWKYCLERAPEYLIVGRGSAFDVQDTVANLGKNDMATFSPWFAFQTRMYHSGPMSLLIDYGLPGLLVAIWLSILLFRRFWMYAVILGKRNTFESKFTLYWCAYMLWHIVGFYFVYGSTANMGNRILAVSAFLMVLYNSWDKIDKEDSKVAAVNSKV